ncbi:MAG: hypothetical protein JW822_05790 [Spirochaetales bacterium]|nr:hypothetical protein [Spirochaetales bacterium]
MDTTIENIKKIKRRYEKKWLSQKGVVSVGIGILSSGGTGIIVAYTDNLSRLEQQIPRQINDVSIELRKTDEIKAL